MNNPMDNHNNVSAALRVSTLFLPFIFLFSDFQNRFHIRKHYSRLVFFPLHFWAWNGHTTTEMKILVGSSAPHYHHHLLIINFQYHYVGCTAGDLEEEEEEELIETRLYEKGERREGRSCWLTMPFNVLSHQPEKEKNNTIDCVHAYITAALICF